MTYTKISHLEISLIQPLPVMANLSELATDVLTFIINTLSNAIAPAIAFDGSLFFSAPTFFYTLSMLLCLKHVNA